MGSFYQEHCIYLPYMGGWFLFSSLLSAYNKLVFGNGHMAFPCPLLITAIHFLVQWIFSCILTHAWPSFYGGDQVQVMSWKTFLAISIPCGFVAAADVGLSNLALVRITITFYTMVKASAPIFVVTSAFIFGIEKITWGVILVVLIISAGEFLTVMGEVDFDLIGMLMCLAASMFSGMRWTVVQLKLKTLDPPLKTAIATMRVLSPTMFGLMLGISLALERPWSAFAGTAFFDNLGHAFQTLALALAGAAFAVCMILCELHLIMKSSAFVLMIGGVVKELCTISLGVLIFGDELNASNCAGFFVVLLGVVLYKVIFHLKKMEGKYREEGEDGIAKVNTSYRQIHASLSNDAVDDDNVAIGKNAVNDRRLLMAEAMELFDDDFSGDNKSEAQGSGSSHGLELPAEGKSRMPLWNTKSKYSHVRAMGDELDDEQKNIPTIV